MSIYRALAAIALLGALAACGTDGEATGAGAAGRDDATGGAPAFQGSTASQTAKNKGEWDLVLEDVRVAEREGYDRVVLEFAGTGIPGWTVGYVAEAVLDGSGERVSLDGDAILDVYASGTTWPGPEAENGGPRRFRPGNGDVVADVHVVGTFEGDTQVLVGIDGGRAPYRAFALSDPARLVVDVRPPLRQTP
jgi:hypothetical protein